MIPYDHRMWMSAVRYQKIASVLKNPASKITREQLLQLLTKPIPDGLSCQYYYAYFGTLWSMIFDLTAGNVEVCFGSPVVNDWHSFDLNGPVSIKTYPAKFPLETPDHPDLFFRQLKPGAED